MAPEIPPELMSIVDEGAGRLHPPTGSVAATTAKLLARHEEMVRDRIAEEIEAYRNQLLNRSADQRPDAVTALAHVAEIARGKQR